MHLLRFSPRRRLEALAVDDAGAGLVVLLLRAPKVLEGAEGREDGTTDPDRVLALRRSIDLDLDVFQRELLDFVQKPITKPCRM